MNTSSIKRVAKLLKKSQGTVAVTGAGLSMHSGIPDFRRPKTELRVRADLSQSDEPRTDSIREFPQAFYNRFGPLVKKIFEAEPNPAHFALATLETSGYIKTIITQNADLLHQRAGSQQVIETHGSLAEATCIQCYKVVPARPLFEQFFIDNQVPCCQKCGGVIKPNVILAGKKIPRSTIFEAQMAILQCDVMLIAGVSHPSGPATAFVETARRQGIPLVIINLTPTPLDSYADIVIHSDVVEVLPALADILCGV